MLLDAPRTPLQNTFVRGGVIVVAVLAPRTPLQNTFVRGGVIVVAVLAVVMC